MSKIDNPFGSGYGAASGAQTVSYGTPSPNGATPSAGDLIKETTTAAFSKDVIAAFEEPAGPCGFLGSMVRTMQAAYAHSEKAVRAAGGRVKLVKMNIDDHPSIAGQLGIQSIPAVIAFADGKPLDGFMGALPESKVTEFIDRIASPDGGRDAAIQSALDAAAHAVEAGDVEQAAQIYSAVLGEVPDHVAALAGLANCLIELNDLEKAKAALEQVPAADKDDAGVRVFEGQDRIG